MSFNLGISSRKIISIVFLVATIFVSLVLSSVPMLISNHSTSLPTTELNYRENMTTILNEPKAKSFENVLPRHMAVEQHVNSITSIKPISSHDQSTKSFDQIFSLAYTGENFNVVRNY